MIFWVRPFSSLHSTYTAQASQMLKTNQLIRGKFVVMENYEMSFCEKCALWV